VTVIVPHGGVQRLALLQISLPRLHELRGIARVVVVELDETRRATELSRSYADFHAFAPSVLPSHKSWVRNINLAFVRTTRFLWLDGDLLLPDEFATDAPQEYPARDLDCLVPWTEVQYLSNANRRNVATHDCAPHTCKPVRRVVSDLSVPGGAVLVGTNFAHHHGGMGAPLRCHRHASHRHKFTQK
jgi:hypothetical protein